MSTDFAPRRESPARAAHARHAARAAALLPILAAVTGCLGDPSEKSNAGSAAGGWQLAASPACTQRLSLDAAGRFSLASWVDWGTLGEVEQIEGSLAPSGTLASGQFTARFLPDTVPGRNAGVYCNQWDHSPPAPLPFSVAEAALGVDPRSLIYTADLSPGSGLTLTGSANRRDRLILYVSDDRQLKALRADDPGEFPNGIYRALPGDPDPISVLFNGAQLMRIPDQTWSAQYVGTAQGDALEKLLLHIRAGADVTFSGFPGSSAAACTFILYQDATFAAPIVAGQLDPSATVQLRTVNPAAPGWPFASFLSDGVMGYLVPVAVRSPADGDCGAAIRSQSISSRVVAGHAAIPGAPTMFSIPVPTEGGFLIAHPLELAGHLERIPLGSADLPLGQFHLTGSMASITGFPDPGESSVEQDPLRLAGPGDAMAFVLVTSGAGTALLNVFPAPDARTGFGPFAPVALAAADTLAVPDERAVAAPYDGYALDYRLRALTRQRVALWTNGGIATHGRLMEMTGRTLVESTGGAADGTGFRIEASLSPGDYWLRVTAAAGAFSLLVDELSQPPSFADAGLQDCLIEAGWIRYPAMPLRSAWCARRNIQGLDGVELVTTLRALDLTGNGLRHIDALQNLPKLETLLLGGNPLADIAPLAGLNSLLRLSLAGTALGAADLAVLGGLSGHLVALDLTGIATLSDSQIADLRAALPLTAIVGPAGDLVP